MNNPKLDFPTVIKTSIPSITKHPRNISPSSKHNTNQGRITFKPDISKPYLLSFLHSMYNSIKLNNYSSLKRNAKKTSINSFILPRKIFAQVVRSWYLLAVPSVLILTEPGEGNSHIKGRGRKTLPLRVLIPKKFNHVEIQHIILHWSFRRIFH